MSEFIKEILKQHEQASSGSVETICVRMNS